MGSLAHLYQQRAELAAMQTSYRGDHYADYKALDAEIQEAALAYAAQWVYTPQYQGAKPFIPPHAPRGA